MIVWGGSEGYTAIINTGGRYNPATNSWTATTTANAPYCAEPITRQSGPAVK